MAKQVRAGYAAKIRECHDQGGGLLTTGFRRTADRKLMEPDPETMPLAVRVWELAAEGLPDASVAAETGLTL